MKKVFFAGKNGMVGFAIWRKLDGSYELLCTSSKELDLRNQVAVNLHIKQTWPDVVINAAACVIGILANNQYPYQFLMNNMLTRNNLISASL